MAVLPAPIALPLPTIVFLVRAVSRQVPLFTAPEARLFLFLHFLLGLFAIAPLLAPIRLFSFLDAITSWADVRVVGLTTQILTGKCCKTRRTKVFINIVIVLVTDPILLSLNRSYFTVTETLGLVDVAI